MATCAALDAEALYSARSPAEYEQVRSDRRDAYEYLPTDDVHWRRAFDAQRSLALTGRHRQAAVRPAEARVRRLAPATRPGGSSSALGGGSIDRRGESVLAHVEAVTADVALEHVSPYAVDGGGTSSAPGYGRES